MEIPGLHKYIYLQIYHDIFTHLETLIMLLSIKHFWRELNFLPVIALGDFGCVDTFALYILKSYFMLFLKDNQRSYPSSKLI